VSAAPSPSGRADPTRRRGDAVAIAGDYQARAVREGFVVQRFWHSRKMGIIDGVCPPAPGSRALDVGCGSGVIAEHLAETASRVDAVDANPSAIAYARAHSTHANVHYHLACVEDLAFEEGAFDYACCLEVIEHLHEPQIRTLLGRIGRLLKPGGRLVVTTPNYQSLWPAVEYAMDAFGLAPRMQGDQHVSRLTPSRLYGLGRRAGLREVRRGRFCGLAPFASVLSWRLAEAVDHIEARLAGPLGHLLYAVWAKP